MGYNVNIHLDPVKVASQVLVLKDQYPSRLSKRDKEASLVLVLHQGNTLYKRRSNRFTTIVLQRLRIQEQDLNRKL
jgi:hypothetical protein